MGKRRMLVLGVIILAIILLMLAYVVYAMRAFQPQDKETIKYDVRSDKTYNKSEEISILTWNLGYAGLGKESAFFYSSKKAKDIFPPSREHVRKNLDGELNFLSQTAADVILLQEVTTRSSMNFNIPMYDELNETLQDYNTAFSHSVSIKVPFIGLNHGNALFSKYKPLSIERYALPLETAGWTGVFNQKFHFMVSRFEINNDSRQLVIINTHFAAFDDGGIIRGKQLENLVEFIDNEHQQGNYVIAGGDWNLMLDQTNFPYDSEEQYLSWRQKFMEEVREQLLSDGWTIPVDITTATVRSLEKPYDGNNFTTIIDGFICSPNIEVLEVKGIDMKFEFSDHNPVLLKVKTKE